MSSLYAMVAARGVVAKNQVIQRVKSTRTKLRAQGFTEYIMLLGGLALLILVAAMFFSSTIANLFNQLANKINELFQGAMNGNNIM